MNSDKGDIDKNYAQSQIDNCRTENYKGTSNLVVSISWAACVAIVAFDAPKCKLLLCITLILFSISLFAEFAASSYFIKSCEDENPEKAYEYTIIGRWIQQCRNISFILGFLLFLINLIYKIYGNE